MALALALLFAIGGLFAAVALVLPHPPGSNEAGITVVSAAALGVALTAWLMWRRTQEWMVHVGLVAGTVMISIAIFCWHPGAIASAVAMLYAWVTLYAFYFFARRAAWAHTAGVGLAYAITLGSQSGNSAAITQWTVTVGTAAVAGVVIGQLVRDLERISDIDPLTGVANRRAWERGASAVLERARRSGTPVTVAMADLDEFKNVNDAQGHAAGDDLLTAVAAAWSSATRPGDLLGRYGGDEFVVLFEDCDADAAAHAAGRLLGAHTRQCTIGVATWDGTESLRELLRRADQALYVGKSRGGRQVQFHPADSTS
jgi:diguanylate cyclase (GGDEF)-like protein